MIPAYVTTIFGYAFESCVNLEEIVIPEGVKSLGYHAFDKCSALKEITIPTSVTSIAGSAFLQCKALSDVYYNGTKAQWESVSIDSKNEALTGALIHCTDGVIEPAADSAKAGTSKGTGASSGTAAGQVKAAPKIGSYHADEGHNSLYRVVSNGADPQVARRFPASEI